MNFTAFRFSPTGLAPPGGCAGPGRRRPRDGRLQQPLDAGHHDHHQPPCDRLGHCLSGRVPHRCVFGTLGTTFEAAHPGTTMTFNFGSSGTLATQITQGAPADVFASAAGADDQVKSAGIRGTPVVFARNSLEIVVKPGNPLGIHSLADLTKANVVAICVSSAPCGSTAHQALPRPASPSPLPRSPGPGCGFHAGRGNHRRRDAAIVYVTNAKSVGDQVYRRPHRRLCQRHHQLPIAVIRSTKERSLALAWIAYVLSPTGQNVLRTFSFLPARWERGPMTAPATSTPAPGRVVAVAT